MAVSEQLAREARVRPRQAVIAGVGGLALFAAAVIQASGPQPKVSELTVELLVYSRRGGLVVLGAVLNGIGLLLLAATLVYLFWLSRARRPGASRGAQITAIAGGVLSAAGAAAYGIEIAAQAHRFATHGAQTYPEANALLSGGALPTLQYVGLLGSLLLAVAFVLVSLNAMRVGLLTRFLGYLGIVSAAASVLLIDSLPAQVIEIFWLLAVAYLIAGRWPGGDPPSWRTGEAEPWPTSAQLRAERDSGAVSGRARPAKPRSEPSPVPAGAGPTPPSTPKRKRKRRK